MSLKKEEETPWMHGHRGKATRGHSKKAAIRRPKVSGLSYQGSSFNKISFVDTQNNSDNKNTKQNMLQPVENGSLLSKKNKIKFLWKEVENQYSLLCCCLVVNSHALQHARLPCPSPSPGVYCFTLLKYNQERRPEKEN